MSHMFRTPQGTHLPLGDLGGHVGLVTVPPRHLCHGRPAKDHYLPDLHHLRLELEEAATPEGHAVRFGFNPLEFENFSWRGYAHMTPIQVGPAALSQGSVQERNEMGLLARRITGARSTMAGEVTLLCCLKPATAQDCGQAERDFP